MELKKASQQHQEDEVEGVADEDAQPFMIILIQFLLILTLRRPVVTRRKVIKVPE